jgi:hypothetical protein
MIHRMELAPTAEPSPVEPPHPAPVLPWSTWLREGVRAGFLLPPRVGAAEAGPRELAGIVAFTAAVELVLGRFEVPGEADFHLQAWLASWWTLGALALLVWALLERRPDGRAPGVGTWFTLWLPALLPSTLLSEFMLISDAHEQSPAWLAAGSSWSWLLYAAMLAWLLAISWRLARHLGSGTRRSGLLAAALLAVSLFSAWQFPERPWRLDPAQLAAAELQRPRLELSQEAIEQQQALWGAQLAAIAPQRPGVVDVYGIVFSPFAEEDVFLRENKLVAGVLAERFDAGGRVLQLANHPGTNDAHPWATPLNLRRAVEALAQRMDRQEDVLVLYLTSHGASNFQLAASHWPLQVPPLSPSELRLALDEAGIRHRVIAISACYSGGWVGPLASDTTLVMTAADAEHTSYGCGRKSELTFFGRAVFGEQLRRTRSFEQAFAAAVPVIKQREVEAGKPDGFSNPQISVGSQIGPVLKALEQRLEAAPAKP